MAQHWQKCQRVKRTLTYRTLTIAVGILVAVAIALTFWIMTPPEEKPSTHFRQPQSLLQVANDILDNLSQTRLRH